MNHRSVLTQAAVLAAVAGGAHALTIPFPLAWSFASLNGSNGFTLFGAAADDSSGHSVAGVGDVNGDGIDDFAIGARYASPDGRVEAGETYIVFGAPGPAGDMDFGTLAFPDGVRIWGEAPSDESGRVVCGAGDVNGDGFDDVAIYAPGGAAPEAFYIVFGAANLGQFGPIDLGKLKPTTGVVMAGSQSDFGADICGVGDVNGDGYDDVAVGKGYAVPAGEAYIVFGSAGIGNASPIDLDALDGSDGFIVFGPEASDLLGWEVSAAGDVNGDLFDDLILSIPRLGSPTQDGGALVLFGGPSIGAQGFISTNALRTGAGYFIRCSDANAFAGGSATGAGDLNGDGLADVAIGSSSVDVGGVNNAGRLYVVFGAVGVPTSGEIDTASLDGSNGFVVDGRFENEAIAATADIAGDINDDGFDDLLIGAPSATAGGLIGSGKVIVVFGGPAIGAGGTLGLADLDGSNGFEIQGATFLTSAGRGLARAGDVNGDGIDDLIAGAENADPLGRTEAGESYVVFGRNYQTWIGPVGGVFDEPSNWLSGAVPFSGSVTIEPPVGLVVTGPAGAVQLDELTLGAGVGRTELAMQPGSILHIDQPLTVPPSAEVTGGGTLACDGQILIEGLVRLEDMDIAAPANGLAINPGGRLQVVSGLVDGQTINNGDIELASLSASKSANVFETTQTLLNSPSGQLFVYGDAFLRFLQGIESAGGIDFVASQAIVTGDLVNFLTATLLDGSFVVWSDDVNNQGAIIVSPDSTLTILGSLTGNGVSGVGGASGPVFLEGAVNPGPAGDPAEARFEGEVSLGVVSVTTIEIASPSDLDRLATTGHLSVGGTLIVSLENGYQPQPGDVYDVLDFASLTGSFSIVQLDQTLIDLGADISDLLVTGEIRVPGELCPGDVDGDNDTDVFDFAELALAFGTMPGDTNWNPDADLVPNGTIDVFDFATLAEDFGCVQ